MVMEATRVKEEKEKEDGKGVDPFSSGASTIKVENSSQDHVPDMMDDAKSLNEVMMLANQSSMGKQIPESNMMVAKDKMPTNVVNKPLQKGDYLVTPLFINNVAINLFNCLNYFSRVSFVE